MMQRDKIKQICKERGMSVRELEKKAGLSGNTITRWTGGKNPSIKTLARVAEVLGMSVPELLEEG